jgi:hypothetical protein
VSEDRNCSGSGDHKGPVSLRIPDEFRSFFDEAVSNGDTTRSKLLLGGAAIPVCLLNQITLKDTRQVLLFNKNLRIISSGVALLGSNFDLVKDAGVTQEELTGCLAVFAKLSAYIRLRKEDLEREAK